jgi:glycosyltransferase involved in cell wall biosynthesis
MGRADRSVSVAMCTCNGAAYVGEQLRSFASQSLLPGELVVSDDGSTDATLDIVREFARTAPFDVRIRRNEVRVGAARNFGNAIGLLEGEFLFLSDQDDVWRPGKLERMVAELDAGTDVGLVFSDAALVDSNGAALGRSFWGSLGFGPSEQSAFREGRAFELLLRRNVVAGMSMGFRSRFRDRVLPVPEGWVHDAWIALVISASSSARPVAEELVEYRQHGAQQIGARRETWLDKVRKRRSAGRGAHVVRAAMYQALLTRISGAEDPPVPEPRLASLRARAAHWRTRARMRESSLRKAPLILGELLTGRYGRHSSGWRT